MPQCGSGHRQIETRFSSYHVDLVVTQSSWLRSALLEETVSEPSELTLKLDRGRVKNRTRDAGWIMPCGVSNPIRFRRKEPQGGGPSLGDFV